MSGPQEKKSNSAKLMRAMEAIAILGNVIRQETHHAAAPIETRAKVGTPARESVRMIAKAATPKPPQQNQRSQRGKSAAAAATSTGPTKHMYIDRLLACAMVPTTRSKPVTRRCLST